MKLLSCIFNVFRYNRESSELKHLKGKRNKNTCGKLIQKNLKILLKCNIK